MTCTARTGPNHVSGTPIDHYCREWPPGHDGPHVCSCRTAWTADPVTGVITYTPMPDRTTPIQARSRETLDPEHGRA